MTEEQRQENAKVLQQIHAAILVGTAVKIKIEDLDDPNNETTFNKSIPIIERLMTVCPELLNSPSFIYKCDKGESYTLAYIELYSGLDDPEEKGKLVVQLFVRYRED